ncbi:hypothetical protein BaRGS_00013566 [Batillaria attramentaria]|uniref:Uncharacterized protein n=1 Tax=Batillaria attramentaria TaxID=370345 RepID=A0ABD0L7B3_9CAEN
MWREMCPQRLSSLSLRICFCHFDLRGSTSNPQGAAINWERKQSQVTASFPELALQPVRSDSSIRSGGHRPEGGERQQMVCFSRGRSCLRFSELYHVSFIKSSVL